MPGMRSEGRSNDVMGRIAGMFGGNKKPDGRGGYNTINED
jgi:hypothetical protein